MAIQAPPEVLAPLGREIPSARSGEVLRFARVLFQLLLVGVVLHRLDILEPTYRDTLYVAFAASPACLLIPGPWRLRAFVLLSQLLLFYFLGWTTVGPESEWQLSLALQRLAVMLLAGLTLISICRLKVGYWWRVTLLLGVAGVAAAMRADLLWTGDLLVVWVLLSFVFLHRTISYLYETSTMRVAPHWGVTLAYFFGTPNACTPLLPLIDFRSFLKAAGGLSSGATVEASVPPLYQRGADRIVRGITHLLVYRYVEQVHVISTDVYSGPTLAMFLVTNVLLYVSISGSMHIVTGVLLLFGFTLPESHVRYFLAESFTDYWRRAHTFWRQFMINVYYYPAYFRLRRLGDNVAILAATALVFVLSWLMHVYQEWWYLQEPLSSISYAAFWAVLGSLVMVSTAWDLRKGTRPKRRTDSTHLVLLRTAGTFSCMGIAWSFAGSPSLAAWLRAWSHADLSTAFAIGAVLLVVISAKYLLEIRPLARSEKQLSVFSLPHVSSPGRNVMILLLLLLLSMAPGAMPDPDMGLGRLHASLSPRRIMDALEDGDSALSSSMSPDRGWRQFQEILLRRPIPVTQDFPLAFTPVADYRLRQLRPNLSEQAFGTRFQTNRWGMRDVDRVPAPAALQVAVLGGAFAMGWGVEAPETFPELLEQRLATQHPTQPVEVWNFAAHDYSPLSQISVLDSLDDPFAPDVFLLLGHPSDPERTLRTLLRTQATLPAIADPELSRLLDRARAWRGTRDQVWLRRMAPHAPEVLRWSFSRIATLAGQQGAQVIFAVLPASENAAGGGSEEDADTILLMEQLAREAGMLVVDIPPVDAGRAPLERPGQLIDDAEELHAGVASALYQPVSSHIIGLGAD